MTRCFLAVGGRGSGPFYPLTGRVRPGTQRPSHGAGVGRTGDDDAARAGAASSSVRGWAGPRPVSGIRPPAGSAQAGQQRGGLLGGGTGVVDVREGLRDLAPHLLHGPELNNFLFKISSSSSESIRYIPLFLVLFAIL